MKIKLLFTVFLFAVIFHTNLSAQSVWTTQYLNNIGGNILRKIQFVNENTGWASGGNGTLIRTTNGGENWSSVYCGTTKFITSLYFLNENTGWVGAQEGFVRKTTDGGTTWYAAPITITNNYWTAYLSFINEQTGYASCITGMSKTTDGGLTWNLINSASTPTYNALQFFNENTGYVMGSGTLFKSVNGGTSWTPILSGANIDENLYFLNNNTGWVLGSNEIRKTTDGCDTWSYTSIPMSHPYAIKFVTSSLGWCVGQDNTSAVILRTTDAGNTWVVQKVEPLNSYYDISFVNQDYGLASGKAIISYTSNGSLTSVNQISSEVPDKYSLKQNYPNPFNPSTKINYDIKTSGFVSMKVFDALGKEVASLVNENQTPGTYQVGFNAAGLNSGIYFYTLTTGNFSETKKMILVK